MMLPAAETGRDSRIIKWLGGYALLTVAFLFAGGVWVLLPEKRRLEQVQRAVNAQPLPHVGRSNIALPLYAEKVETVPRLSGEAAGTWPQPSAVKAGAASASAGGRTQTAPATGGDARARRCQRFTQDPVSLFMTPAGIDASWRGWSVALTTDYAGLEHLLNAIAALQGCLGLQALALKATPEGLVLNFRLTSADKKEDDNG